MYSLRDKIWTLAVVSRVFILVLQCVSNLILPDHYAKVFKSPMDPDDDPGLLDNIVHILFGGLFRWDAQYFLHVAKYGYTYENCLAFFPLLPILAHLTTISILSPFSLFFSIHSLLQLSFVSINIFCFVKAAIALYDISLYILKDEEMAYRSCVFFCLSPASIFFTAPYSESLFAWCTFSGIFYCITYRQKSSAVAFAFSTATRSNGVINIGFTIHKQLRILFNSVSFKSTVTLLLIPLQTIATLILIALSISVSLVPFILFQVFSFGKFCIDDKQYFPEIIMEHADENNYKIAGSNPSLWCNSSIPLAYSYVQAHYWDVGLLKYYQWKQLPNFALALPAMWLIIHTSVLFFFRFPKHCLTLGFRYTDEPPIVKNQQRVPPPEAFVYIFHAMCLLIFCVLCVNVQVTTRMIASSSPVMYWCAAYLSWPYVGSSVGNQKGKMICPVESRQNMGSSWRVFLITQHAMHSRGKIIRYYFIAYFIVGTVLFSNHFPWT